VSAARRFDINDAINHLRQERRFFRKQQEQNVAANCTIDERLEEKQHRIMRESLLRNELGLYRNASLLMACLCIARSRYDAALERLLDVAFFDINGATNSLPNHKSFDEGLASLLPFVCDIITDVLATVGAAARSLEEPFKARWSSFARFGPPTAADVAWKKVYAAISDGDSGVK
jgi:hypothetical protein